MRDQIDSPIPSLSPFDEHDAVSHNPWKGFGAASVSSNSDYSSQSNASSTSLSSLDSCTSTTPRRTSNEFESYDESQEITPRPSFTKERPEIYVPDLTESSGNSSMQSPWCSGSTTTLAVLVAIGGTPKAVTVQDVRSQLEESRKFDALAGAEDGQNHLLHLGYVVTDKMLLAWETFRLRSELFSISAKELAVEETTQYQHIMRELRMLASGKTSQKYSFSRKFDLRLGIEKSLEVLEEVGSRLRLLQCLLKHHFRQSFEYLWSAYLLDSGMVDIVATALRDYKNKPQLRAVMGTKFLAYFETMVSLLESQLDSIPVPMGLDEGLLERSEFFEGPDGYVYSLPYEAQDNIVIGAVLRIGSLKSRTSATLAKRLQLGKPEEFAAIPFRGFFRGMKEGRSITEGFCSQPTTDEGLIPLKAAFELPTPSAYARAKLAQTLALAVFHLQMVRWYHGGVSMKSVLVATRGSQAFQKLYLTGFRSRNIRRLTVQSEEQTEDERLVSALLRDRHDLGIALHHIISWKSSCSYGRTENNIFLEDFIPPVTKLINNALRACFKGHKTLSQLSSSFFLSIVLPLQQCWRCMHVDKMTKAAPGYLSLQSANTKKSPSESEKSPKTPQKEATGYHQSTAGQPETTNPLVHSLETLPSSSTPRTNQKSSSVELSTSTNAGARTEPVRMEQRKIFAVMTSESNLKSWNESVLPQIEKLIERLPAKMKLSPTSIDLLGIGATRENSRPTIVVSCDAKMVNALRTYLDKKLAYDKDIFDLKVRKGGIDRACLKRKWRRRIGKWVRRAVDTTRSELAPDVYGNRKYQDRPVSGASIGACRNNQILPAATFGGIIAVDGKPYGLTVHHLLDPLDDEEDLMESDWDEDCDARSDIVELSDCGSDIGMQDKDIDAGAYESDDESVEGAFSLDDLLDGETEFEQDSDTESAISDWGDVKGLDLNHGEEAIVTQPCPFDYEDEELHSDYQRSRKELQLGTVAASSGLRRIKRDNNKHEVDWALLEVDPKRLDCRNVIRGGGRYCRRKFTDSDDLRVRGLVGEKDLKEKKVHALGRTSGLQQGMVSAAMSSTMLPGRRTFSKTWHVIGKLGVEGDSGSWVIDNEEGNVCGHVIARDFEKQISYITPMELLLDDIKSHLKADNVELPRSSLGAFVERDATIGQPLRACSPNRSHREPSHYLLQKSSGNMPVGLDGEQLSSIQVKSKGALKLNTLVKQLPRSASWPRSPVSPAVRKIKMETVVPATIKSE